MSTSLERLAELVRQAESKTRARKIEAETRQAAEQFRAAEERSRRALDRMRAVRPASVRAMEKAEADEQLLKDLVRKLAQFKSSLSSDADAEDLIANSRAEIDRARHQAKADLEEAGRELDDARRELRVAVDQYRPLRRELERLQPSLVEQFAEEDRLLWDAEGHFPGGQLQLLGHEVEAGFHAYASLPKLEQYARLKVWIGRFRHLQASHERDGELTEELQALGHRIFHQLKWLSRQYEPGYIEAFRQDFSTDWAAYVAEAQEQLIHAIEAQRRQREVDRASEVDREPDAGQDREGDLDNERESDREQEPHRPARPTVSRQRLHGLNPRLRAIESRPRFPSTPLNNHAEADERDEDLDLERGDGPAEPTSDSEAG